MKLLTKEDEKVFEEIGSQENVSDPVAIVKFFNPAGAGRWFATEYNPETKTFFGYVSIFGDHNDEWGYFSLEELKNFIGFGGIGIERDLFFKPTPMSKIIEQYTKK